MHTRNLIQRETGKEEIRMFRTIEPEASINVEEALEWEMVEFVVDSGASETVMNGEVAIAVPMQESPTSRSGVTYETANGERIENEGQKVLSVEMKGGARRMLTTQICDVSKPLMSVRRMVEMGHTVVFSPTEQYVDGESTGEVMEMDLDGGMYTLKTWVKAGVF